MSRAYLDPFQAAPKRIKRSALSVLFTVESLHLFFTTPYIFAPTRLNFVMKTCKHLQPPRAMRDSNSMLQSVFGPASARRRRGEDFMTKSCVLGKISSWLVSRNAGIPTAMPWDLWLLPFCFTVLSLFTLLVFIQWNYII